MVALWVAGAILYLAGAGATVALKLDDWDDGAVLASFVWPAVLPALGGAAVALWAKRWLERRALERQLEEARQKKLLAEVERELRLVR